MREPDIRNRAARAERERGERLEFDEVLDAEIGDADAVG